MPPRMRSDTDITTKTNSEFAYLRDIEKENNRSDRDRTISMFGSDSILCGESDNDPGSLTNGKEFHSVFGDVGDYILSKSWAYDPDKDVAMEVMDVPPPAHQRDTFATATTFPSPY